MKDPRHLFGVHGFTPYNRDNGLPYGVANVLKNSTFSLTGEQVQLYGGAQKAPYAIEDANITSEIQLNVAQYEDWMFQLFMGKAPTNVALEDGVVSALTNKKGTSVMSATTGIASIATKTGGEVDLKFGKYLVKAVSTTAVDVYALTDIDFSRGTAKAFVDETLKITATPLTIVAATAVEIPGFGIELTGGSGTIGLTVDDTAIFDVVPPATQSMEVILGGANDVFPEFGALMLAQQRSNGELFEVDAFRCKGAGLPLSLQEKTFGEAEIKATAFYDSVKGGICKIRAVKKA